MNQTESQTESQTISQRALEFTRLVDRLLRSLSGGVDPILEEEVIEAMYELRAAANVEEDAKLFRYWIDLAERRPGAVATALANCVRADDYRQSLRALRATDDQKPAEAPAPEAVGLDATDRLAIELGLSRSQLLSLRQWLLAQVREQISRGALRC